MLDKPLDEFENAILNNTDQTIGSYKKGDVLKVKIVKIDQDCLLVDLGRKSEIFIPLEEVLYDPNQPLSEQYKVGEEISVKIVRDEKSRGGIFLSQRRAMYQSQVDIIEKAFKNQDTIPVKVRERVKGGLVVDINGIQGFLPSSLVSVKRDVNLDNYIGQSLPTKIIEFDPQKRKVVVSHKVTEEEELNKNRGAFISSLEINSLIDGTVTNVLDYGAFVDIGYNIEGLVHISELTWSSSKRPNDVVKKGDAIKVRIIGISEDQQKISLSYKRTLPDPWEMVQDKYKPGDVVEGTLVKDLNFGAIVELEDGINAFLHISQVSHRRINSIKEELEIGDKVSAEIVEIDTTQKKIKLSRKNLLPQEEPLEQEQNQETVNQNKDEDLSSFVDVFVPKKAE
ncbi:MAG: S1 RNA-binding domain-containing protein [Caldisericia bacterium]|nr:S1 RNA-binding domain-containing protein [Caldisericia bacterium]